MSLNFPRGQETLRTQAVAAWCGPAKLPGLTGAGDMLPVRGAGTGLTGLWCGPVLGHGRLLGDVG
jgi:hypothetical protein